jgi:hypothetical protein
MGIDRIYLDLMGFNKNCIMGCNFHLLGFRAGILPKKGRTNPKTSRSAKSNTPSLSGLYK